MRNTIVLVLSVQTLKLVLGMGIALLLNQAIRFRQFLARADSVALGHARLCGLYYLEIALCAPGRRIQLCVDPAWAGG